MSEFITLEEWATNKYSIPPSANTLRGYAKAGRFNPPAEKVGRYLMVHRNAYLETEAVAIRANEVPVPNRAAKIISDLAA